MMKPLLSPGSYRMKYPFLCHYRFRKPLLLKILMKTATALLQNIYSMARVYRVYLMPRVHHFKQPFLYVFRNNCIDILLKRFAILHKPILEYLYDNLT